MATVTARRCNPIIQAFSERSRKPENSTKSSIPPACANCLPSSTLLPKTTNHGRQESRSKRLTKNTAALWLEMRSVFDLWPGGPGRLPAQAPTDPYMDALDHTAPRGMVSLLDAGVDDFRRREAITLQQPFKSVPVHVALPVAAVKPHPPSSLNRIQERLQHSHVVGDPIVSVMSANLLTQYCMLLADRSVPVVPTPLGNAPHRPAQTLRGRLPHYRPTAPNRATPVMGETQEVKRSWSSGPVVPATCRLAGRSAKGNQPGLVGMERQAVLAEAFRQHLHHPPCIFLVSKQDHEVVRVADQVGLPRSRGCTSCRNHMSST